MTSPLLCPELRLRLITDSCPLWYAGEREIEALSLDDPYWGFCWAGGQALARYILDRPKVVQGRRIMVFGAGCGIEAIAAAKSGAAVVAASDIDPFAVEATMLNARLNEVRVETTTRDLIGDLLEEFDVLFAGDMFYDPAFSTMVLAWLEKLSSRGLDVYLADPGRGNVPLEDGALRKVAEYEAPADVDGNGSFRVKASVFAVRDRWVHLQKGGGRSSPERVG